LDLNQPEAKEHSLTPTYKAGERATSAKNKQNSSFGSLLPSNSSGLSDRALLGEYDEIRRKITIQQNKLQKEQEKLNKSKAAMASSVNNSLQESLTQANALISFLNNHLTLKKKEQIEHRMQKRVVADHRRGSDSKSVDSESNYKHFMSGEHVNELGYIEELEGTTRSNMPSGLGQIETVTETTPKVRIVESGNFERREPNSKSNINVNIDMKEENELMEMNSLEKEEYRSNLKDLLANLEEKLRIRTDRYLKTKGADLIKEFQQYKINKVTIYEQKMEDYQLSLNDQFISQYSKAKSENSKLKI